MLLEQYLAIELKELGFIDKVIPIFIGDYDPVADTFDEVKFESLFPADESVDFSVDSVNKEIKDVFEKQSLGLPVKGNRTIREILKTLKEYHGIKIEGVPAVALAFAIEEISKVIKKKENSSNTEMGSSDDWKTKFESLCTQLESLKSESIKPGQLSEIIRKLKSPAAPEARRKSITTGGALLSIDTINDASDSTSGPKNADPGPSTTPRTRPVSTAIFHQGS